MKQKGKLSFYLFCAIGLAFGVIAHFVIRFFFDIGNYTILAGALVFVYVLYLGAIFDTQGKSKMLSVLGEHLFMVVFGGAFFAVSIWLARLTGLKGVALLLAWLGVVIVLCAVISVVVISDVAKNKKREKQ